jgi:hypothetical protein
MPSSTVGKVYKYNPEKREELNLQDRNISPGYDSVIYFFENDLEGEIATASELVSSKSRPHSDYFMLHEAVNDLVDEGVLEGEKISERDVQVRESFSEESTVPPSVKETLAEEGIEIYDQIRDILESHNERTRATTALKLACDEYGCATSLNIEELARTKFMKQARDETGIRQVLDPSQVVDATVTLINEKKRYNSNSEEDYGEDEFVENSDEVRNVAEAILDGKVPSGNPKVSAAGAVWMAAALEDYDLTQREVAEAVGSSPVGVRNNYRKLLKDYTNEETPLDEVPESELDDIRDQIYEEVK